MPILYQNSDLTQALRHKVALMLITQEGDIPSIEQEIACKG